MQTVHHRLRDWAASSPDDIAHVHKTGGQWTEVTAKEYLDRVYWLALFFASKGFTKDDIGCIFSYNRPEWVHAELALTLCGGMSAGIYPNSIAGDAQYILTHSEAKVLVVQDKAYFDKMLGGKASLPPEIEKNIRFILVLAGDSSFSPKCVSYMDAINQGKNLAETTGPTLEKMLARLEPHAPAYLIYTSGTTARPKGAILSHDNVLYAMECLSPHLRLNTHETIFSFLPLCHVAEKVQTEVLAIILKLKVHFCTGIDNLAGELAEVRPTCLLLVPRVLEKMKEGVNSKIDQAPSVKQALARWALRVGAESAPSRLFGAPYPITLKAQYQIADRLVLSKLRKALGLDRVTVLIAGAAPLSVSVIRWVESIGLSLGNGYGQTETAALVCFTDRGKDQAGTIGKQVQGVEYKLAEDGEILVRGRVVFKGYLKDEDATKAAFSDGWLCTGDTAERDAQGCLRITGRKKEVMKTSGGKLLAPLPIEEALKESLDIGMVCLVGEGQKFISALVTLSESAMNEVKKSAHPPDPSSLTITDPAWIARIQKQFDRVNETLSGYARVKKFAILAHDFSIASGELTPTLKMKRFMVEKKYAEIIADFYR